MDLDVVFVGTSGSMPTAQRAPTATLVRRGGERLLFDCAEGTQRQLLRSDVGLVELREVFLTHFHADHSLGLPGMLKTFALRGRELPLTIYGPRGLVLAEGRLVDEHVGAHGCRDDAVGRSCVAAEHERAPGPSGAEHVFGRDHRAVGERHCLSALQRAPLGSRGNAEGVRGRYLEAARPLVLDEGIAERRVAVTRGECVQPVAVAVEHVPGLQLDEVIGVRQAAEIRRSDPISSPRPRGP